MKNQFAGALLIVFMGVTTNLFAQVPSSVSAAAQELVNAAYKARLKGNYATACPRLEEALRLLPDNLVISLELARCYEGAEQFAKAFTQYLHAQKIALSNGSKVTAQQVATAASALRRHLAPIVIHVPGAVGALPEVSVKLDGVPVERSNWGTQVFTELGAHVITVMAPGYSPWTNVINVNPQTPLPPIIVAPLTATPPQTEPSNQKTLQSTTPVSGPAT